MFVDINSNAVHCDIVLDYSAKEVVNALSRFISIRGHPSKIMSDPGSQLTSVSGDLKSWWSEIGKGIVDNTASKGLVWEIRPAGSPWRQGKAEVCIKTIKRLIKIAAAEVRLTPSELQTALYDIANVCNERPIGLNKVPNSDGLFDVITPNCLMLGRSTNAVLDDSNLGEHLKKPDRYLLIKKVTQDFWNRWTSDVTPIHVTRQKWNETKRNLKPGDIVLVHDKSPIRGKYMLGVVDEVKLSSDGLVRSCIVRYRIPSAKDGLEDYSGGKLIRISRSVQRLSLILGVEEQDGHLTVENGQVKEERRVEVDENTG